MTAASGDPAPRWPAAIGGIRVRLALAVALALLPATVYALVQAERAAREDENAEITVLRQTLDLVADGHESVMAQARQLLTTLSGQPAVRGSDLGACDSALAAEAAQGAAYRAFVRTDTRGVAVCASHERMLGLDFADRQWFRSVMQGEARMTLSDLLMSRDPDTGPTVVLATSLLGPDGMPVGTLATALSLGSLLAVPQGSTLPDRIAAALVDGAGAIAVAAGAGGDALLTPDLLARLQAAPDAPLSVNGPDGQPWRFLGRLPADPAGFRLVVAGLPATPWSWLDTRFQAAVVVPALLLLLSIVTVWVATGLFVTRPVLQLAERVRRYRRLGGSMAPEMRGAPSELAELAGAYAELTEQLREREEALRGTLAEKDALLREIHHRVKNNLQIVTSLLNLRAASATDETARRALGEARLRVEALSLVNRGVQVECSAVALDTALEELAHMVHELDPNVADRVRLELGCEPLRVAADQATPIVLLATELLSNAMEHAFVRGRVGVLSLRLVHAGDGGAVLEIGDDGGGLARATTAGGAGFTLVTMLAKQAGGMLDVDSSPNGMKVRLKFMPQQGQESGEMSSPWTGRP
ncbi:MAG: sensor histidine kinase [Geminicoccaceae bacterium]